MKKNGFTLVELLGVIVLIAILGGLAVVSVNNVIQSGKNGLFNNYEKTMEGAAQNAITDYVNASSNKIENSVLLTKIKNNWNSSSFELSYSELLNNKYIDELKDSSGEICDSSKVIITKDANKGNNIMFKYKACVICGNYKTKGC